MSSLPPVTLTSAAVQGLRGVARVPGDKSISHRALMLGSQVIGTTNITGLLEGEDVLATAKALRMLGVNVEQLEPGNWRVNGVGPGGLSEPADVLDMGNAGTGARLLMGLLASYPFSCVFTGDASLRSRPMKRVITPLTQMGATFVAREQDKLPLTMTGAAPPLPITYTLPVASAQVKSAVLLAGLNTPGDTSVIEPRATRDHTENMLAHLGFEIRREPMEEGIKITLPGQQNPPRKNRELQVPADPSSAAFLIVAALITKGSELTLPQVCLNPTRTGLFTTLQEMGADITYANERMECGEKVADLTVKTSSLKGVTVPAERAPSMIDEYPILAVAAAFAEGKTVMKGLGELRVKESDRFRAIIEGLNACGVPAEADGDDIIITGQKTVQGGGLIATRLDHRIAMSFLVLGMASQQPVSIDDGSAINTSFPGFAGLCNSLGASIQESACSLPDRPLVIAVDGPAASGKGTLARRLAEHFGLIYLDTGSLYRAVGLKLEYNGKDPHDEKAALEAAENIDYKDLANPRLRQEHIGKAASVVSAMPQVRNALLEFQRKTATSGNGAVLDGRDIGTVVCPDAPVKFYLTANMEARARRRHRELSGQGIEVVFESVLQDLQERDERDSSRTIAPLKPAIDAIVIDTSTMDANSVLQKARQIVLTYLSRQSPDRRKSKIS